MTIDSQRRWKQKQVQTALTRIGLIDVSASKGISVGEVIGTEEYYNYRAKLTPHVSKEKGITSIGFYGRKGKDIIDVDQCAIATTAINRKYTELREQLSKNKDNRSIKTKKTTKNKQKEDTLSIREANGAVSSDETKIMTQTVKDFQYEFRAGDFFQNNPFLLPLMVDYVLAEASEIFRTNISNAAEIAATVGDNNKLLVDAYCGSGLFAISASKLFKKVIGIEVSEKAVASAKRNAEINNVENCEFISGEAQEIFKCITKIENSHEGMDLDSHYNADNTVVIIDPPRRGCDEVFIRQLLEYNPKIIVYVSCDPVTQARDARDFINAGYVIKKITPFDLFPQTRHLENVITFSR